MAFTADELAWLREQLGTIIDEDDIEVRRLRLLTKEAVARSVIAQRLADLEASPSSFTVVGEYSQDTKANIDALRRKLDELAVGDYGGLGTVVINAPASSLYR